MSKKKPDKKIVNQLKDFIIPSEHNIIDDIIKKIPGIEKGLLDAANKIKREKSKPTLITQTEFARQIGYTRQAISKAIKTGVLPTVEVKGKIKINPANRTVAEYAKNAIYVKANKQKSSKTKNAVNGNSQENSTNKDHVVSSHILGMKGGRKYAGALRTAVMDRDNNRCIKCGKSPADGACLEVDHIIEFEDGGKTTYENGQTLCGECNKGKSAFKKISKSDELISMTEFGRRVGVHRNGIAEAIKKGEIEYDQKKGKINYTTEIIKWFKKNKKQEPGDPGEIAENDIPDYLKKMVDSGDITLTQFIGLSKSEADKIKIYEQLKQIRQDRLQKRKKLIDIKFIKLIFGKVYDIDVSEFMAIKTRLKPHLAKIFKTNDDALLLAAEKAIDDELWDTLRRVKFEFEKFLDKSKNEN